MATVDGLTKARMLAIEAMSVVSGVVDGSGHLILEQYDGTPIDAGLVKGADGLDGANGLDGDTVFATDKQLILNPNFELLNGAGTDFATWGNFWVSGTPTRSIETVVANVYNGTKCPKVILDNTETQRYSSNVFAVAEYEIIHVRARFKASGNLTAILSFASASPADPDPDYFGSGTTFQPDYSQAITLAGGWTLLETYFIVPAGDTKARVWLTLTNSSGGTLTGWIDAAEVVAELKPALASFTQPDIQVFTANGTWNKPVGAKHVVVEVVGGGAAGGGCAASGAGAHAMGGGGGAGGYAELHADESALSASVAVTIGAGGTGVSNGTGNSGGQSSFGAYAVAPGGTGGGAGGSSTVPFHFAGGGAGGIPSAGTFQIKGESGDAGRGGGSLALSGSGGGTKYGPGGNYVGSNASGNSITGQVGTGRGSGGSGAASTAGGAANTGGAGVAGQVIVTTYFQ